MASQPERCSCQPCGDFNVTLIFIISSGTNNNPIVGANVMINDELPSLETNDVGIANTNRPVSDVQVSVVISAENHSDIMLNVEILPPGPIIINVILSPVVREVLGSSTEDLVVPINSMTEVDIPANSIVTSDGTPFNGSVTAEINIFTANTEDTYSDSFPPEVVTEEEGSTVFYQPLVLARTELLDDAGETLDVDPANPVTVVLTIDLVETDDVTVLLLLFNDTTGLWVVHSNFTFTLASGKKRQAPVMAVTGSVEIPNANQLWSVCLPVPANNIIYLQVRVSVFDTGAIIDVEFPNNVAFFRSSATTGVDSGPLDNSVCIEVRQGVVNNGAIQGTFNGATLTPSVVQPDGFTVEGNAVTFTGNAMGSPFYATLSDCIADDGDDASFVSFEPLVSRNPQIDIPPPEVDDDLGYWYIQAQVLSCFDSNRVIAASIDTNSVASFTSRTATATLGAPIVSIPADINPSDCTGAVTARTVCLQVYPNSTVTVEAEQNAANPVNGDLCYVRAVSDEVDSNLLTIDSFNVTLDLGENFQDNNPRQGIYFDADSNDVAFIRCTNNINQPVPLGGSFVQFECFERELTM